MKELNRILLSLVCCSVICESVRSKSLAPFAINSILREYFASEPEIDVIYFGVKGGASETLAEEILRNNPKTITVQVSKGDKESSWNGRLNISSIAIFDSSQNFKETVEEIKWVRNPTKRHKHLVYAPQLSRNDILRNVPDGFLIDHVNFLMHETEKSIELVSSFMFTKRECHSNQLVTINQFMGNTKRWESSDFYPRKYQNLHGCTLKVKVYPSSKFTDGLKTVAKSYNFKTRLSDAEDFHDHDLILKQNYNNVNTKRFITSVPHNIDRVTFAIPQGELYTPLEKMFLMFDFEVWVAITIFLSIGLATIQVINCMSVEIRNFVFGRKIQTPTLNMVSIFLNGGQLKVPGRNFARFIFILFIIWSLIIRTCYQSILFNLFQADPRKPQVQSIDELVERGFTLYGKNLEHFSFKK